MTDDDSRREFLQFLAEHDVPAFIRRAHGVTDAWKATLSECEIRRTELLEMPRMRLGVLAATIGHDWNAFGEHLLDASVAQVLQRNCDEWKPELRVAVSSTTDRKRWTRPLDELVAAFQRFNKRWLDFVEDFDLSHVNGMRDEYNQWYVIEKSCAFDSDRIGAEGFVEMEHATTQDVLNEFPLLDIPQFR